MISQDYFDEVWLDNVQVFDMSEEEALKETIAQLSKQSSLDHLSLTLPRQRNETVDSLLRKLAEEEQEEQEEEEEIVCRLHKLVFDEPDSKATDYHRQRLVGPLLRSSLLQRSSLATIPQWLELLQFCVQDTDLTNFRNEISRHYADWAQLLQEHYQQDDSIFELAIPLLTLSVQRHELNKKHWMRTTGVVPFILQATSTHPNLLCPLITSLCTFDDPTAVVASSHAHVQKLKPVIGSLLQTTWNSTVIYCLASLAIQQSTIQTMMDGGLVELLLKNQDHRTARLALARNACQHDACKNALMPDILGLVVISNRATTLQACGLLATVTLRQSAERIKVWQEQYQLVDYLVQALERYQDAIGLQRNACRALRNILSRQPQYADQCQTALYQAAVQCPDEAYAALRDAGLQAVQYKVTAQGVEPRYEQFGQAKSNFRAVYD